MYRGARSPALAFISPIVYPARQGSQRSTRVLRSPSPFRDHSPYPHRAFVLEKMSMSSDAKSAMAGASEPPSAEEDPTVQYVVVRRDLLSTWPTGSVIAQAVHASVAAVWESRGDEDTVAYCGQDGNTEEGSKASPQMHTVVLEAKNEAAVLKLADKLNANGVKFAVWREQPEDFVTALAAKPYPRSEVKKMFSKFKLFK